jgi:hypothetical protein
MARYGEVKVTQRRRKIDGALDGLLQDPEVQELLLRKLKDLMG